MPDGRLLEQPGRDLVQERLERVVVALVDDHDVDLALRELLSGSHTGEPASEDEHDGAAVAIRSGGHEPCSR
jgi:hypothetical protein